MKQSDSLHQQQGYELMGAAFEVYNELGQGFLEEVYHEALEIEFRKRSIPFVSKSLLPLSTKDRP
jgi:GxxExxY protein